jgi:hypothetical protein
LDGNGAAAEFLYCSDSGFGGGLLGVVVDGDVAAAVGQSECDGFADAAAAASDESDAIL